MKSRVNLAVHEFCYNHGLARDLGYPRVINIETTNRCNLDCIMCPRSVPEGL